MKTLKFYQISSTRCCGIWGEERFDLGDGRDVDVFHGFETEDAARAFIGKEVARLQKEPGFYKDILCEAIPATRGMLEYKLTYSAFSTMTNQWHPIVLKFRISEKEFKILEADEAFETRFH